MSDWAKTLLARVARALAPKTANGRLHERRVREISALLEKELLGLLEAGEAMYFASTDSQEEVDALIAWNAALDGAAKAVASEGKAR